MSAPTSGLATPSRVQAQREVFGMGPSVFRVFTSFEQPPGPMLAVPAAGQLQHCKHGQEPGPDPAWHAAQHAEAPQERGAGLSQTLHPASALWPQHLAVAGRATAATVAGPLQMQR